MMSKYFSIAILCLFVNYSFAQKKSGIDVVYLKDGSMVKGLIFENISNDHVKIEAKDGTIWNFKYDDIESINPDENSVVKVKDNGYYNNTSMGVLIGDNSYTGSMVNFSFNMVNGYQIKQRWQTGVGTGMDIMLGQLFLPVTVDVKYVFRKKAFSPFVGVKAGYAFSGSKNDDYDYPYYDIGWYYPRNYEGGPVAGIEVGIRNYSSEHFGLSLHVGYRTQQVSTTTYDYQYNIEVVEKIFMQRFNIGVGILFH
jgi:hypothetical protein